ncbi:MAG: hypothetical protein RL088_1873 [Verrucomicrobiota bacterium]|jgi:prephenate dehydrogenase
MLLKRIAILGPGLLGGSIALRLREVGGWHVTLWTRREATLPQLRERGVADAVTANISDAVRDADVVVLCVPIEAMGRLAEEIAHAAKPECIVTDVGSVKASVVAELDAILSGKCRFIGSHPMAGKAESGIDAAEASLFRETNCIITPTAATDAEAIDLIRGFWETIGCRVVSMGAGEHDECVALISHLPHLVAGSLVRAVADRNPRAFEVVGPGFRDTTRVAGGPPELWTGIMQANRGAILEAIDAMIAKLYDFRQTLERVAESKDADDLKNFLAVAKQTRDQIKFPK